MLLSELRTLMQGLGYGTDTVAAQNVLLQQAYQQICTKRPWHWLRVVFSMTSTYGVSYVDLITSLTYDPRRLHSVAVRDTTVTPQLIYPLDYWTPQKMKENKGYGLTWPASEYDLPEAWSWYRDVGNTQVLHLWRPPDLAYAVDIELTRPANTLSETPISGEPYMPEDYQPLIVFEAILMMALRQRDRSFIDFATTQRDDMLRIMEHEDSVQQTGTDDTVEQTYNWDSHARRGGN